MKCEIAELIVDLPEAGGMHPRCREYCYVGDRAADIVIRDDWYRKEAWPTEDYDLICYMESGIQFYARLLRYSGLMLHASAVALDGKAYLFSGPSGRGKSTHTRLWQQTFGSAAQVFNDDKPALRKIADKWYAYGTPWCGKDGINQNVKVPLAGICFLKQSSRNAIRRISDFEAIQKIISQTRRKFSLEESVDLMLENVEGLVRDIPVFELENQPEPSAVQLSYETMFLAAEERGL